VSSLGTVCMPMIAVMPPAPLPALPHMHTLQCADDERSLLWVAMPRAACSAQGLETSRSDERLIFS